MNKTDKQPQTVEQAVDILLAAMPLKDKNKLTALHAADLERLDAICLWIRDQFDLQGSNRTLRAVTGEHHPDRAALAVLTAAWERLTGMSADDYLRR